MMKQTSMDFGQGLVPRGANGPVLQCNAGQPWQRSVQPPQYFFLQN